jgi:hypothetical protein
MKKTFLFLTLFQSFIGFSQLQNFYDRATIQTIEVFFSFSNWDAQLDAAVVSEAYIIADSVRINGVSFDSCGVKYKGNSSYNPTNQKNPLHIELDHVKGNQDYQGYTDIKLQNGYKDPSMIREVLSYAILEQYMDCPKGNFANVYVNGAYRGLYSSAESINKTFNANHYYQSGDTYFKCNPVGGAGPGSTVSPDLKYISMDSSAYANGYELRSTYGWNRLVDLINTLNNDFTNIESKLDIDRAIWMLAFNNVLVNLDSYSGAFRQNYYLTWDNNARFVPTVWDLNMSFGGFPGGTGSGTTSPTTLDPLSNSTSTIHPLIVKIMANPMYKRMYLAHVRTIVQEMFANDYYLTVANQLRSTIDATVNADPYKFYTYAQFQNSLTTAVTGTGGPGGGASIPGLQALMSGRVSYFNTNANYVLVAPTITSFSSSVASPVYNQTITINATCSNESAVFLGYRTNHQLKFNRIAMYDDGAHNDGAANDHVYGADALVNGVVFEYYIYTENSNAGLFSPQRAEHEYHTLTVSVPFPTVGSVLINEVVASNSNSALDQNGENDDWIELYNTTSNPIDLSGMYLTDDALDLMKWSFPVPTTIPANGYIIVWADNDVFQAGLHASFKLNASGESVILSNGVNFYDQVGFGVQSADVAYARCPDGGATFAYVQPTYSASNNCYASISQLNFDVKIFPNPFNDKLTIQLDENLPTVVRITDVNGKIMFLENIISQEYFLSTANWCNGMYIVTFENERGMKSLKLIK